MIGDIKNSKLPICAFHIKLWNHILGQLLAQHRRVQDTKGVIRIMTNPAKRVSCCSLFRELGILPLQAQ
jgi:hypothetical protein